MGAAETTFIYDGSLEGLLTAIFVAYAEHVTPNDIIRPENAQIRLGQEVRDIEADPALALRVQRGISRRCGPITFDAVKSTSLSDDPQIGTIIYQFLRYALAKDKPQNCSGCPKKMSCGGLCVNKRKSGAINDVTHPAVAPFFAANRFVHGERHRMMQFLRFEQLEGDLWFARCSPQASVIPLIMDWFTGRFNTQAFLIYDDVHHLAGVYEGREWYLVKTDQIQIPQKTENEMLMQQAWKRFYRTIAVESRYNPELRQQFMPKRFWRNITEMQEDIPLTSSRIKKFDSPPQNETLQAKTHDSVEEGSPTLDTKEEIFRAQSAGNLKSQTPVPSKAGIKLSSAASPSCQK